MSELKPILLAEDSPNDIEMTLAALRKLEIRNEIVVARHGEEVMDYLHRRGAFAARPPICPSVILLDLKMPKVDGLEVLRWVKGDETFKVIPVVMLTSSREEADLVRSYQLGVNAYVVKPVGYLEFVEAIRQITTFWTSINQGPPEQMFH